MAAKRRAAERTEKARIILVERGEVGKRVKGEGKERRRKSEGEVGLFQELTSDAAAHHLVVGRAPTGGIWWRSP